MFMMEIQTERGLSLIKCPKVCVFLLLFFWGGGGGMGVNLYLDIISVTQTGFQLCP